MIERTIDPSGNAITYRYTQDAGADVLFGRGALRHLRRAAGLRVETRRAAMLGWFVRHPRLALQTPCVVPLDRQHAQRAIDSLVDRGLLPDALSGLSLLTSVRMTSHGRSTRWLAKMSDWPATKFGYTRFQPSVRHRVD